MLSRLEHKVPPPIWALLTVVLMMVLAHFAPLLSLDFAYRKQLSVFIGIVGGLIDVYSVYLFVRAKTTVNPLKPSASSLIVSGMYKFSRNPMYLGMLIILSACGLYLGALSALLMLPVFVLVMNKLQIAPEERQLRSIFPQDYPVYCQRVRRWL